jgi:ABA sandwich protein
MNDLPAGRELDARVAEKVMGLAILTDTDMEREAVEVWKEQPQCMEFLHGFSGFSAWKSNDGRRVFVRQKFLSYSSDISAAWRVVEKLRAARGGFDMGDDLRAGRGPWYCRFHGGAAYAEAASPPLAICRAALKAVGHD